MRWPCFIWTIVRPHRLAEVTGVVDGMLFGRYILVGCKVAELISMEEKDGKKRESEET